LSHDGDGETLISSYDYYSESTCPLANIEGDGETTISYFEMQLRGREGMRTSSEPYKRALENNSHESRKLNWNERFNMWVLNRRERKKLMHSKEDIWLRWGPNARGGDDKNNDNADEGEVVELDDEAVRQLLQDNYEYKPLEVCGRAADIGTAEDLASQQRYAQCPQMSPDKPIAIINGYASYGRTGNKIVGLLH
jgi:hypothetical protein